MFGRKEPWEKDRREPWERKDQQKGSTDVTDKADVCYHGAVDKEKAPLHQHKTIQESKDAVKSELEAKVVETTGWAQQVLSRTQPQEAAELKEPVKTEGIPTTYNKLISGVLDGAINDTDDEDYSDEDEDDSYSPYVIPDNLLRNAKERVKEPVDITTDLLKIITILVGAVVAISIVVTIIFNLAQLITIANSEDVYRDTPVISVEQQPDNIQPIYEATTLEFTIIGSEFGETEEENRIEVFNPSLNPQHSFLSASDEYMAKLKVGDVVMLDCWVNELGDVTFLDPNTP